MMPRLNVLASVKLLFYNLSNNTCANCTSAFSNSKTKPVFHRNRMNQLNSHLHVITRHHHLSTRRQLTSASHIRCTEVKLWTITFKEWCMTTTFIFT